MKICWDNLEGFHLTKNGNFRLNKNTYVEREVCKVCGNPYLSQKKDNGLFCSHLCANSGKNNPMYGKVQKYKGGVFKSGLTIYDTYSGKLKLYEDIRKQEGTEVLEAKCAYCGRWCSPTRNSIDNRLRSINNIGYGEGRLYCSENCKLACPTYGQREYPKGFKHTTSREVSAYLRQIVLERDNWICQICGKTIEEIQLHVHHMDPVAQNPMFQNDMDSCTTLCKKCHAMVHSRRGCRYVDLVCKKVE